jgi:hypothetical protein
MVILMEDVNPWCPRPVDARVPVAREAQIARVAIQSDTSGTDFTDNLVGPIVGGSIIDDLDIHVRGAQILLEHAPKRLPKQRRVWSICGNDDGYLRGFSGHAIGRIEWAAIRRPRLSRVS